MSFLDKTKNKLLTKSNSYNFYKEENDYLKNDLNEKIDAMQKELNEYKGQIESLQNANDTYYNLFNIILVNYELKPRGMMKKIQDLNYQLLLFVSNVCCKHDLDYWIDYGTLLGAIRHGTYIPWDDDVDISMMRKDFDGFYDIINDELELLNLDDDIIIDRDWMSMKDIIVPFIQVTYKHDGETIGYVDIFSYDFIDTDSLTGDRFTEERDNFYIKLIAGQSREDVVDDYLGELDLKYDDGKFIIPGPENVRGNTGYYRYVCMKKDVIFPLSTIKFKDTYFKSPNNIDLFLKLIYGDYKNIPRNLHHHNVLDKLNKIENIDELLDIGIEKVKKANSNF